MDILEKSEDLENLMKTSDETNNIQNVNLNASTSELDSLIASTLNAIIATNVENNEPKIDTSDSDNDDEQQIISEPEENLEENFFKNKVIVEISRLSWETPNYLRGCKWSPDGTCCLTSASGDGMHIVELPAEFYESQSVSIERPLEILNSSAVHVPESGTVYDFCWYPQMNSMSPTTCSWIASRQHEPIHMFDAFYGQIKCSYRGYDNVDEVEAAISLNFSQDGSKIYAGYKKSLKIFKTSCPGREYESIKTKFPVSALATSYFHPDVIAIGSWNSNLFLCDEREKDLNIIHKLTGHKSGITLVRFSPDGRLLLSGSRKENKIFCWDMREPTEPFSIGRTVKTNQRIYFDMSANSKWLISGDTDGLLHIYDFERTDDKNNIPVLKFPLHKDCCNGASFHPYKPILATSTGQHHYQYSDENIDPDLQIDPDPGIENSLIFWWFGKCNYD